ASMTRIMMASARPPANPAMAPYSVPTVVDTTTASNATGSDTRAPYITRLSTSRLAKSVPNGCASDGGRLCRATMSGCAMGEYGASHGASAASPMRAISTPIAMRPSRCSQRRAKSALHGSRGVSAAMPRGAARRASARQAAIVITTYTPHATRCTSALAHARIRRGVEQVREQTAGDHERTAHNHRAGDERVVARADGVHGEQPHAGPREDLLHEHRAAQESRQREAEECDHGKERIAPLVAEHDAAFGHTLGARGANEILVRHVEHRRALEARHDGGAEQRQRGGGKREVPADVAQSSPEAEVRMHDRVEHPRHGEEPEPVGEHEHHHEREPEFRHRIHERSEEH